MIKILLFILICMAVALAWIAAVNVTYADAFPRPTGVSIIYGECPGYAPGFAAGCAMVDPASLASGAYGEDCRDPDGCIYLLDRSDRMVLWHELGHVWDARKLSDSDRRWFARLLGRPAGEWFLKPGQRSAGELFAEAFTYCAAGFGYPGKLNRYESSVYGYALYLNHPLRHRRICTAIRVLDITRGER